MNVAMYYIAFILEGAGITGQNANLQTFSIQNILYVVMVLLAILFINRWCHRFFLLISYFLMALQFFLMGDLMSKYGSKLVSEGNSNTTFTHMVNVQQSPIPPQLCQRSLFNTVPFSSFNFHTGSLVGKGTPIKTTAISAGIFPSALQEILFGHAHTHSLDQFLQHVFPNQQ